MSFIDCGHGDKHAELGSDQTWLNWTTNANATACFTQDGFPYGIYVQAVNLTSSKNSAITRYVYSLFWGFQVTNQAHLLLMAAHHHHHLLSSALIVVFCCLQ